MVRRRLGVLDVGSNSVHLLVVDARAGARPWPTYSHKNELRLAELLDADGNIVSSSAKRLVGVVEEALRVADDQGVEELIAFATSAMREAGNGADLRAEVQRRTGVDLVLLSGEEEARLTFLAAHRWYGWSAGRLLVLDIGGGSLEIAAGDDETPDVAVSLPLGAGRLTREWLTHDPPKKSELPALRKHVRREVARSIGEVLRGGPPGLAVGTSKTFRQLARITGAASSNEGPYVRRVLQRAELDASLPKLAAMSASERAALPGVSATRAPQLVAGAVVADAALHLLDVAQLDICPWALREGVILRRLDRESTLTT